MATSSNQRDLRITIQTDGSRRNRTAMLLMLALSITVSAAADTVCGIEQTPARLMFARALALTKSLDDAGAARAAEQVHELAAESGDRGAEALALTIDAGIALRKNDLPAAARLAVNALEVAESAHEPAVVARAWLTLAEVLRSRAAAPLVPAHTHVECLQKALTIAEEADDRPLQAAALLRLGDAANVADDYITARSYFDRALDVAHQLGDAAMECELEIDLAILYYSQHEQERGLFHQRQAVKLAEEHHLPSYPRTMLLLGFVLGQDHYEEGRAILEKILPRDEHGAFVATPAVPKTWLGFGIMGLANIERNTGRLDEAECLARQGDDIFTSNLYQVNSMYEIAFFYMERHDYATAFRLAMESVDHPQTRPATLAKALMRAARAYRGVRDPVHGMALIREAIDLREEIDRGAAGDEEQHVRISEWCADYYEVASGLALDLGDTPRALRLVEQGRAGVLTGILENGRPNALAKLDEADRNERRRRERELAQLRVKLDSARSHGRRGANVRLNEQLRDARAAYESFVDGIRTRSQRRFSSRSHLDAQAFASILARLPRGMAAVEFMIDDDEHLSAFVVRRDAGNVTRVVCRTTTIKRKAIEERVNRFVDMVTSRDLHYREAARDVYDLLIRPIEADLHGAHALLVVPDEVLWRVPFAALVDARERFLVERAPIVYAPSITAYVTMTRLRPRHARRAFFGVANPSSTSLEPLPEADEEIEAVQALYGARHSKVLEGNAATETRTRAELGNAAIVHFATHALFDDANPMYSRLLLARDARSADDGSLEAWEIAQLHLDADLIILSACNTARGSISHGEGVVGMVWAFFVAGARSTLATQWSVASGATAKLMIAFHQSLRRGDHDAPLRKAQALRDAQLTLLRQERYAHPFQWAGFALYGDASYRK